MKGIPAEQPGSPFGAGGGMTGNQLALKHVFAVYDRCV